MTAGGIKSGERVAVIVTGIVASISTLSVTLLLLHIFYVAIIPLRRRPTSRVEHTRDERIFLRTHLGIFVVCLLCSDLIQGISGYFQFVWAAEGRVIKGSLCTAQAAMLLFGDNGTAVWAAVISFHTVLTVVGRKKSNTSVVTAVVLGGWAVTCLLTFIGPLAIETKAQGPFYGIAGAWCFVTSDYKVARIIVHYIPILISASLITVNYALVALVISGLLVYQNHTWKFVAPYRRQDDSSYRWHRPSFSFSRIQRSPSSASNSGQSTGTQSVGSKEVDGGVGRAPHTAQSSYSNATKGTPQDFVSTLGNNHQGEPTVLTTRAEPLRRRPVIPKSQAQFKGLALKMLWYPIVYIALILPITCSRLNFKNPPTLPVMLAFMCLLWLMGLANVIIYVTTRRIGGSSVLRNRSILGSRRKASQEESEQGRSIQILVDRHTKVDHVIGITSMPGSPSDSGSPQYPCFDPSPTFPAKSYYPPTGATDGDLEAQRRWWSEPYGNEKGTVLAGRSENVGVAV